MVKKILYLLSIVTTLISVNAKAQDSELPVNNQVQSTVIDAPMIMQTQELTNADAEELAVTTCDSASAGFAGGNKHNGNMFDVVSFSGLIIKKITVSPMDTAHYKFYYHMGSYHGFESFPAAWTLIYTSGVLSPHTGGRTVTLPTPLTIPAGETFALYVTSSNVNVSTNYTNDSTHTFAFLDSRIGITVGCGLKYPFCAGGAPFQKRKWNGKIHYCFTATGIEEEGVSPVTTSLYPNPISTTAILLIDAPTPDNYTLQIFDLLGNVVNTMKNITGEEITIEKGNLNSGIYFYRLQSKKGYNSNGKFVIE